MAKYKETEKEQGLFLAVSFPEQLAEGTFEYTLDHLIDNMDLSVFDGRYANDRTGAPAINPAALFKIILYCYSIGVISSRKIAKMCENHLIVKALSGNTEPHYTTISNFVSTMGVEVERVFSEALPVCQELKLIGRTMFAVDGRRLPSSTAKEWSGTKSELGKKHQRLRGMIRALMKKHREEDMAGKAPDEGAANKLKRLKKAAKRIHDFLSTYEDRKGAGGEKVKSNITDNEFAE